MSKYGNGIQYNQSDTIAGNDSDNQRSGSFPVMSSSMYDFPKRAKTVIEPEGTCVLPTNKQK